MNNLRRRSLVIAPKLHTDNLPLIPLNMSTFYDDLSSDSSGNMSGNLDKLKALFTEIDIGKSYEIEP